MAYDRKKTYERAIKIAKEKKCYFIEQVVSFSGISKQTFYDFFKVGSDELDNIKEILIDNKVNVKSKMYEKWYDSDNATLQVALMKLICNEEEAHRLNGTKIENKIIQETDYSKLSTDELIARAEALRNLNDDKG